MAFSTVPRLTLAAILSTSLLSSSLLGADRKLANGWDVRDEVTLRAGADPALVKEYLPSFLDYLDTVLFHPTAGYYSSGRVDFATHFRTFPIALSPYFGQMLAEQIFHMWQGMRAAGALGADEKFTIAEFGAGNGALAESILDHIDQQALKSDEWRAFQKQVVYACYDRSPALSDMQRKRNARFGSRFEAREGDATNPGATVPPGSLKGVVLSNELPDCFSVHKVILSVEGSAEVAFTLPSVSRPVWLTIEASLSKEAREKIVKDDAEIYGKLLAPAPHENVYLSRAAFSAVLDALNKSDNYEGLVGEIRFQEVYVPVSVFPELARHIRRYAGAYAHSLATSGQGIVTYINLAQENFIQGAGAAVKAGYVITIDYGGNWEGSLSQAFDHFRMYGPGASQTQANPYHTPTLNDMTTDVNFSHLAAEGETVGLKPLYFGPQHAVEAGTSIEVSKLSGGPDAEKDFQQWAGWFYTWEVYKMLVQQKAGTDAKYTYPRESAEPLAVDDTQLTAQQREQMAAIEKALQR